MASLHNRVYWSAVGDPEQFSTPDSGYVDVIEQGGAITGFATLGDFFFVFQEKCYTVYQYQIGDDPLRQIRVENTGCNYERTIVEIAGWLFYLSDTGDIRQTNGVQDRALSRSIYPLTQTIINNRTIKDYYSGSSATTPHAFYDEVNNTYRLCFAGESDDANKFLTYWVDTGIFTTASAVSLGSSVSCAGLTEYIAAVGNSAGNGRTFYIVPGYGDYNRTGILDLGWISSGNPNQKIKVYYIEIWFHAEAGETAVDDCDCTINVVVYRDPETNTISKTLTRTLDYNSVADNLVKKRININAVEDYVRLVLSDSGSNKNYAIDKIIVKWDKMNSV